MSAHTKGPWEVVTDLPALAIRTVEPVGGKRHVIVQTANQNNDQHYGRSEAWMGVSGEANARLIAASPDLLEALKVIMGMTDADDPNSYRADDREGCLDAVFAHAKYAISKALALPQSTGCADV